MKIILSRKGCDSASGRCSSLIFPEGGILSLPIPDAYGPIRYSDISTSVAGFTKVGEVCDALGLQLGDQRVHLDPDLSALGRARDDGWTPTFGQDGAAERHLRNEGVDVGDLFLFFGWFRDVAPVGSRLRLVRGGRDVYLFFGWLQVGQIIRLGEGASAPAWSAGHPHHFGPRSHLNTLYVASETLRLPGIKSTLRGAGVFDQLSPERVLTAPGALAKSVWRLPAWFSNGPPALSFHRDASRWEHLGIETRLKIVGRGQEFVLDVDAYPEAPAWAYGLLVS